LILLAHAFCLFPTGTLPSPRWRPAAAANFLLTGLLLACFTVAPRQVTLPAPGGVSLTYRNPFGAPVRRDQLAGRVSRSAANCAGVVPSAMAIWSNQPHRGSPSGRSNRVT
jgi:hypothetical protein